MTGEHPITPGFRFRAAPGRLSEFVVLTNPDADGQVVMVVVHDSGVRCERARVTPAAGIKAGMKGGGCGRSRPAIG